MNCWEQNPSYCLDALFDTEEEVPVWKPQKNKVITMVEQKADHFKETFQNCLRLTEKSTTESKMHVTDHFVL